MMFHQAHTQICELVHIFQDNHTHYLSSDYLEAQVRQDFIDKLFIALGWDVLHNEQKNPYEQEVKVEKAQRQKGDLAQKRADYAFSLAPDFRRVQFFVEAKKPSRKLRQNRDDYFQTAKYGWNAQTGISILTDFEEIVIIDCRFKPDLDSILGNEIKYFTYTDLLDEKIFAEFYWLFSREAVSEGHLKRYIDELPLPKGRARQLKLDINGRYQSIDESFLKYIDSKRVELAQAFYVNNPTLDRYELTEATQRTIDRLVFMRFLEDKQIEPENILYNIANAPNAWHAFIGASKRLDNKYNGILFKTHFIDAPEFLGANTDLFSDIAADLDHTNTPYDFNYIPIHILGNIYEQFLGNVIEIDNGSAKIVPKPEVRKAGGVYYTPKYIVDYIVKNTVGKLIDGKSPNKIKDMKFADPACGSGSFLIGVYDYLLDFYKKYYNQYPSAAKDAGCHFDEESGTWVLSIAQKQNILKQHVFGVDIDLQATEVTQVSLFLKLLEDETMSTARDMAVLFHEKILPDLSENIKCGNSLIGFDILHDGLDFGDKERQRALNPFEFEQGFAPIFRQPESGFDAIVGNPPYVKVDDPIQLAYFKQYFQHQNYQYDLYLLFLERYQKLLKTGGKLGVIVPNTWLQSIMFTGIRAHLLTAYRWDKILHSREHIFKDAVVDTHVLVFEKHDFGTKQKNTFSVEMVENETIAPYQTLNQQAFDRTGGIINLLAKPEETALFQKIMANSVALSEIAISTVGVKPFQKGKGKPKQTTEIVKSKPFVRENSPQPDGEHWQPLLRGSLIHKYENFWNEDSWIQYGEWLAEPRNPNFFTAPSKIVIRQTGDRIIATQIGANIICRNNLHILISSSLKHEIILGVLNAKLTDFCYFQLNPERGEALAEVKKAHVEQLRMPKITPQNQAKHDELLKLVPQMLQAKQQAQNAKSDFERNTCYKHIQFLDSKINQAVYALFGLNDDDIAVIERLLGN